MESNARDIEPVLAHVEPILAVKNILETVTYWHEVLGFPGKWTWGDPPDHGGVSWQGVFIQFTLSSELAEKSKGNSIWIRVKNIEALYAIHQAKKVEIVAPLEHKPWGFAEYVVKEINGYYLRFAAPASSKVKKSEGLPPSIRILSRKPSIDEYFKLVADIGWGENKDRARGESALAPVVTAVVAEDQDSKEIVGCALLLGDNVSFYYVKDVMVHPNWQHKHVGTALMKELTKWIDENGPPNVFVTLITPENLAPFYRQFDFAPAFGMVRIKG